MQILISTLLLTGGLAVAYLVLPAQFRLGGKDGDQTVHYPWQAYVCSLAGLYSGLVIGWFT
jgi:hypothetical protein